VFLEEHVASTSANLDFTTWYSSTYDEYIIEFLCMRPASSGQDVSIRCSTDGGSSYDTGVVYGWSTLESSSAGSGVGGNQAATAIGLMRNTTSSATLQSSGQYRLYNPAGAQHKNVIGNGAVHTGGNAESQTAVGLYKSTSAVNAFRVFMNGGANITSGTVRVYGVVKV